MTNIVVALGNTEWEPRFVSALGHPMLNISIQRRCLDAIDVRSAIRVLDVDAVLFSDATLRVSEDCINDLRECHVQVIAVSNDSSWWNSIGVHDVVAFDESNVGGSIHGLATLFREHEPQVETPNAPSGRLIAVTGFGGGSGRTTVARELSYVSAVSSQKSSLLVDADVVCPALAIELDDTDVTRGLLPLARLAESRKLNSETIGDHLTQVLDNLAFVRGLPSAGRWTDLRTPALEELWCHAKTHFESVVVDAGPIADNDGSESVTGILPRRSAAFLTSLASATHVVLTGRADNVGITRLVRGYLDYETLFADKEISVALTRGSDLSKQAAQTVRRLTGIHSVSVIKESSAFARASQEYSFASSFDRQISESFFNFFCETDISESAESGLARQRLFLKGIRNSRAA